MSRAGPYGERVTSADTSLREAYLQAAATVGPLLRDPAVAAAWASRSTLAEFSVNGLAGHLASQIFMVGNGIAAAESELEAIAVQDHYARVTWIDAPLDSDFNSAIRSNGEQTAAVGAAALADRVDAAVADQGEALTGMPETHRVTAPSGLWSLRLDDFVLTRLMEIAVHSDDLAVSVGVDPPALPEEALVPVLGLLTGVALRRHGQQAMLRALSRRERAPVTITAF
jgi:hypothetical protein